MKKISILLLFVVTSTFAQKPVQLSSSEIYQQIKKLRVLGNVLYLAAHPDDENTRFIGHCANEKLYNTAYLSLTRGDGGQNLVGPEIREELGIIRTQELLAARRTDGGQQFFSRANDFGYSKTPEETLKIWDKDKILADVVWVIRKFRPDVIVCRFPTDGGGGHGHHTASALLGEEAFTLAADPKAYPEQLKYVKVWQAKRIVVNTGRWWKKDISADDTGVVAEDIGLYNNVLGTSYNELAAKSRSMHKSQGFGSTGTRGEQLEFFEHLKGDEADHSLFSGIITDWSRVKGAENIQSLLADIVEEFSVENPKNSLGDLILLREELKNLQDDFWKSIKIKEVDEIIKQTLGLYIEAKADNYYASANDSVKIDIEIINRILPELKIKSISAKQLNYYATEDKQLLLNEGFNSTKSFLLPNNLPISQPYWLAKEGTLGTYNVSEQLSIGKPENDAAINFEAIFEIQGIEISYNFPLIYKWNDPVKGELYRPFVIVPPVFVNFTEEIQLFSRLEEREIEMIVKSTIDNVDAELLLSAPQGWVLSQQSFNLKLSKKGEEQKIIFQLKPTDKAQLGDLTASLKVQGKTFNKALKTITYDHIPTQVYMPKSKAQLVYIDIKKKGSKVGYVVGAGDVIPDALRNVGYVVDELSENEMEPEKMKQYDAIVLGIRALNTNDRIAFYMPKLLEYSKNGGTLIIQYNTSHRLNTEEFAPYPLKLSRDRVTEEDAEVTFLMPNHPVLNTPNKITQQDFKGWVQERGLYFPNEWDEKYDAILSWHDKGEDAKNGSLLVTKYGEGYFVYTGISFFRETPAGVPGAYRLLVNLISLGNE
jgi:LmbE family N-acetylglucosaminyl deacetylase